MEKQAYQEMFQVESHHWWYRGLHDLVFRLLARYFPAHTLKVLDAGCGTGRQYDLNPYLDGLILRTTDRIGRVMVRHEQRREGRSGYTLRKLISLWLNTFTGFSILPLRIATLLGFVFALVGFVLGLSAVVEKIYNPELPVGYTLNFVFMTMVSGVILLTIGILGEYLGRVYISLSKHPQFVIRKAHLAAPKKES